MFFKAKDYVTAGNAICGLASVVCVIEGHLYWASFLVCFGWLFDLFDGVVARLTNTYNKFGGEFDSMCDHLTYGIAPGFIVYASYVDWMPGSTTVAKVLAAALAFILPLVASIRGALFTVKPVKVTGFWIGLPRPVSAFVIVSFFNTSLFSLYPEWMFPFGIILVLGMATANLGGMPFLSHHGHVWPRYVNAILYLVAISLALAALLGPIALFCGYEVIASQIFFDVMFFWLFGYMLMQWYGVPAEDWARAKKAIADWKKQELP